MNCIVFGVVGCPLLCLTMVAAAAAENPQTDIKSNQLAHVEFTSTRSLSCYRHRSSFPCPRPLHSTLIN